MTDALLLALGELLSGGHLPYLVLGVLVGIAVGVLPGLGGTAGMALLLPFVYGMEPASALAMLIGLMAVLATADTFTSVLMGIPGSAGSQATVMDGFPLAKAGEARRALTAAFAASLVGGLIGAAVLTGVIQVVRPVVLVFGAPELFMLTVLGLSMVGVLSGGNWARGLAACGVGLLIGNIGPAPATGHMRLTFGSAYLSDGLSLVVLALGVFAIPEILDLLARRGAIAERARLAGGWLTGLRDAIRHRWLIVRSSIIGCIVGAIPGLGGAVVDWIAYGLAVQFAKDRSGFGKGDIRGVVAPESANNAKEGGALVPTLIFGIPGSGATAILLGALVLIGLQPGPRMVTDQLDVIYLMVWSLAIANVVGVILCLSITGIVARIALIRYTIIAPLMLAVVMFGAYQATRNMGDLVAVVVLGAVAFLFKRFEWPRPPLLIGFVLARGSEVYLYQSVQLHGLDWLGRPIVLVLIALTLASVAAAVWQRVETEGSDGRGPSFAAQCGFTAVLAGIAVYAIVTTAHLPQISRLFPQVVSYAVLGFAALSILLAYRGRSATGGMLVITGTDLRNFAWIPALVLGIWLIGFPTAVALVVTAFLAIEARMRLAAGAAVGVGVAAALALLANALAIRLPSGLWTVLLS
jgi:putative tricarboxylic transport membrane protein